MDLRIATISIRVDIPCQVQINVAMHRLRKQLSLVIFSAFFLSGCAEHVAHHDQPSYLVSVKFYSPPFFTNTSILDVVAHPGIPFAAQMQDENTNIYRCSGTLQERAQGMVHLDQFRINCPRFSSGPSSCELKLGAEPSTGIVVTILQVYYSFKVTKQ